MSFFLVFFLQPRASLSSSSSNHQLRRPYRRLPQAMEFVNIFLLPSLLFMEDKEEEVISDDN
ncbi:hypothetical protein Bca4012_052167 [Brassica carinata]